MKLRDTLIGSPIPILVVLLLCIIGLCALLWAEYSGGKRAEAFAATCDENLGVAVRDVNKKLRCVPTFAGARK